MKIGIVTYHAVHNYGAMLQAYALQRTLEQLGHEVFIVHFLTKRLEDKNRRRLKSISFRALILKFITTILHIYFQRRYFRFESFMKNNMKLTRRYSTSEELVNSPPLCDIFVCGSDQIWNIENGVEASYFLQFAPAGAKRIAYAPSFGRETIPAEHKPLIARFLTTFSAISVRESSGIKILMDITGKQFQQVLDPVFLLNKNEWLHIARSPRIIKPYIAYYSLEISPKFEAAVIYLSRRLKIPVVVLGKSGMLALKCRVIIAIDSGPQEMLGWLSNACLVCTNSFHAVAFSLLFEKAFFAFFHPTRNTRLSSLLEMAGMTSRFVTDHEVLKNQSNEYLLNVEYSKWRIVLAKERQQSLSYLRLNTMN